MAMYYFALVGLIIGGHHAIVYCQCSHTRKTLLYSDQVVTKQTDPEEVTPIMSWEVEATPSKMKNGKEAGKD